MRGKLFFLISLFFTLTVLAQYPEVSIMDIQFIGSDSLNVYFEDDVAGPYEGDTVTVTGVVMVPPYKAANPDSGTLIFIGSLAGFFMQDTAETEWGGILVAISNPANYPDFQNLDSGTVVKVTGVVTHFTTATQKTTELLLIDFDATNIINFAPRPQPVVLTLDSLRQIGTSNSRAIAEKWEGVYIQIDSVFVTERNWTNGGFAIIDQNNTKAFIYTRSNYIFGHNAPPNGSFLEYVRGVIETRSEGGTGGGATINPMWLTDYKVTLIAPQISGITRDPVEVGFGQQVTITANIEDLDGSVTNVDLHYRVNSNLYGLLQMNNSGGNSWTTILPAYNDSTLVDFYITAEDNDGLISINPTDTTSSRYFYLVLNRGLTIQDVQYSPFGGGFSGYNGYEVTVRGIVTADTSDITIGPQVYIQNGTSPWSGIRINGTEVLNRQRGDDVTVTGTVGENFSVTQISGINAPGNITVNSTGNPLPEPVVLPTSTFLNNTPSGTVSAEQWEGVLVKFEAVVVTDENADGDPGPGGGGNSNFGEMLVDDGSGAMRVELQEGNHGYHNFWDSSLVNQPFYLQTFCSLQELIGIQWFSFSNYKLIPRKDDDFVGVICPLDVEDEDILPYKYSLEQNYPNPFNPSTIISYNIPKEGFVTLKVYNLLGQLVKTLVNEHKSPGSYKVNFEAGNLSSGIYFYSITASDFSNVKKMILIK